MILFTVVVLLINVALCIAIAVRFKRGEKPPRENGQSRVTAGKSPAAVSTSEVAS